MAPLSHVPNEIIDHILAFISTSDLLNLCLTNTSLRCAAEPFLYNTIILEWDYHHIPQIVPLLRTLFQRPELFNYLETVSMNGWSFEGDNSLALDLDSADIPFEQYITAIKKTKVSYTELWIEKLRSGSTCLEALSALFLASISKIRRLAIMKNFIRGNLIGKVFQSKVYGELPAFDQLKEIRYVKECDYYKPMDNHIFPDAISLFYLPTVINIVAWVPNPEVFQWPAGEPNLDHLTSLDISRISEQHLAKILTLTRNLKSLLWTWEYDDSHDPGNTSTLDFDKIIAVLACVRGTLEKLQFRLKIGESRSPIFREGISMTIFGSLDGLASFDRITYLEVPLICLAGFGDVPQPLEDSIPPNTKTLALSEDMLLDKAVKWQQPYYERCPYGFAPCEGIEELIESLADNIPTKLPQLDHLIIFDDDDFGSLLKLMDFDGIVDTYSFGFDIQVSERELPVSRYCFGWRAIPAIDYTKRNIGPCWAK